MQKAVLYLMHDAFEVDIVGMSRLPTAIAIVSIKGIAAVLTSCSHVKFLLVFGVIYVFKQPPCFARLRFANINIYPKIKICFSTNRIRRPYPIEIFVLNLGKAMSKPESFPKFSLFCLDFVLFHSEPNLGC